MNYFNAVNTIDNIPQIGKEPGVVRSKRLLGLMGNPQEGLKVIHVAGTNGKGSVSMFITRLLRELGYSVGTFISPHLVKLNERIMINEAPIDDETFTAAFNYVWDIIEKNSKGDDGFVGYFDVLLAMAMHIYKEQNVDYVVLETGLGGKLDGSNAIDNKLLTVITSISLDHCALLGDTLEKIAMEKAGIMRENVPVIFDASKENVAQVLFECAKECKSIAYPVESNQCKVVKVDGKHIDFLVDNSYYRKEAFVLETYGMYQPFNATIALAAVNHIEPVSREVAQRALDGFRWQGRMEQIRKDVFLDGAHNIGGIEAFVDSAKVISKGTKSIALFSVVKDKFYEIMIKMLCESQIFDGFVVTQIEGYRRLDADIIKETFKKYTDREIFVEDDPAKAYQNAVKLKGEDGLLFIVGSLYLAGIVEKEEENND